jgi:hypothetical protein
MLALDGSYKKRYNNLPDSGNSFSVPEFFAVGFFS